MKPVILSAENSILSTIRLQTVWREAPLPDVALILSGHLHMFQALGFADGRPPQIVTGNSGTELARRIRGPFNGRKIARTTVVEVQRVVRKFGFTEFNKQADRLAADCSRLQGKNWKGQGACL